MDTSSFIYCPPRPPSLRETANADRAFLKEVMGDASTSLAGAEYGLKQVNELFKKIRLLNLNDEAATAFVDANRLFEEIQKDIGSARGNFGVAASAVSAAEQRDTMMVGVAEVAGEFYETQLKRLGLEDDLKGYLPRGADLLDTHRLSVKLLEVELASSTDRIDDVVYEQMQVVADRYLAMGSARIYHNDAARQATCAAADCYRMCCDYATNAVAAAASCRAAFIKDTAASATDSAVLPADAAAAIARARAEANAPQQPFAAAVMEAGDGILAGLSEGKIWAEMSTTDEAEVTRLGAMVAATGAAAVDCPVSGGCHRAATGNIAILAGCDRAVFDRILPVLTVLGRRVLHTGPLGTASKLKVMTNYLATANLVTLCEALVTCKASGLDLNTTYEAIRISSGNSFVHETESQVILNGSRDINFTMDLVIKDISLFQELADRAGVPLEVSPKLIEIFEDGAARFGPREWSPNIIRRLEEATGLDVRAPGFPDEMLDDEPEEPGYEIVPNRG